MATTKYEENSVELIDGTKISLRPLKISLLRPFLKKFEGVAAVAEDNEKSMDVLLDCVQIAFKQFLPELADDRDAIEEKLDLPTVYAIVDAASGIQLGDTTDLLSNMK